MALVSIRVSMPDRPGMLAAVAAAVSEANADIVTIDVVDRADGIVVDQLCLDTGPADPTRIRRGIESVGGVVVESVRAVPAPPSPAAALELAAALVADPVDPGAVLVDGLPAALEGAWAMALALRGDDVELLHAGPGAPPPPTGRLPWLPLTSPRRLAVAPWMPTSWRVRALTGGLELAACPLGVPTAAVLVGRHSGLRFRPPELRQLEILVALALRAGGDLGTRPPATSPGPRG